MNDQITKAASNVIPVCGSCGNDEVTIASHCEWDLKLQEWIAQDPDEAGAYCSKCSEEGNIVYKNIAIPVERMQITIPLSQGEIILMLAALRLWPGSVLNANDLHDYATMRYLDAAQEEFLSRTNGPAMDDRYDREISIADVEFIKDSLHLTVECMLTDNGGDE